MARPVRGLRAVQLPREREIQLRVFAADGGGSMFRPLPFGEIIPPLYEVATARRRGEVERWGVGEGRRSHYTPTQRGMMAARRANLRHQLR